MWEFIGKLAVSILAMRIGWSLLKGFYSSFLAVLFKLHMDLGRTGKWAVVTGATDGIGKQYAFQLAKRGLNIVLISRTQTKLEAVAEEIKKKYPIEVTVIAADYTKMDIYDKISQKLSGLDIGVLVNNVGMGYEYPEFISQVPNLTSFADQMLNINIQSVNRMTFMVLPGMEQRKRGVIINISSLSAVLPTPFLTIYAASKSYVESFSANLDLELKGKGVSVQCVIPGFVVSNLSGLKRASFMAPNPDTYVNQAIATVGIEKRTTGYIGHKLMLYAIETVQFIFPGFILQNIVYNHMLTMRKKFLRKKERENKTN